MPPIYPKPAPSVPFYSPEELWQHALAELRLQMTKAIFNAWLVDSYVVPEASTPAFLTVSVRSVYAREWLTHRLYPVVVRTLAAMGGYGIEVYFVSQYDTKEAAVNPLEDRLHEYLSQFDDEPPMAPSLRRRAYLERQLARAGIVPTDLIELPANVTPDLLNILLAPGEHGMSDQTTSSPTRVRIHSHVTQSCFLHLEDALGIGKLRLFAGNYRKGQGMTAHAHHFLDLADARVVFAALACGERGFAYKEYKGTPPQKGQALPFGSAARPKENAALPKGNDAVSRVLSILVKGESVYVELKTGPGKLTSTGAITPNGKPEVEVNVGLKLYEARRMAASVLAYIRAWDVTRMMAYKEMIGRLPPFQLVAATGEVRDEQTPAAKSEDGTTKQSYAKRPSRVVAGRSVTREGPSSETAAASSPATAPKTSKKASGQVGMHEPMLKSQSAKVNKVATSATPSTGLNAPLFVYGDGSTVDGDNLTEVQTFQQFVAEKKTEPESKTVLLAYYRQRAAGPSGPTGR